MMTDKRSAEKTVRDIRRATRRHYAAEDKIRIVLGAFELKTVLLNYVVAKASTAMSTTAGRRRFFSNCFIFFVRAGTWSCAMAFVLFIYLVPSIGHMSRHT